MSEGPIATEYVEIRPTPDGKEQFKRDVEDIVEPGAKHVTGRVGQAITDGLKNPAGAAAAGAAAGAILGKGIGAGLQGALKGLTALPRVGFQELKDYEAGLAQLEIGLKSTGGVAGLTADELEKLATSVQKYSGQTDDSIVRSESFLLTFDKIRDSVGKGNDIFTRTTKATADLAARFGGEASDKAIMLGKALQDPARGMTALSRAGIVFTDQQKKTIVALDSSGRSLEAQKLILAEVEKQVGGSAKAYGDTLPGQLDRAKRAFEDISQTVVATTFNWVESNQRTTKVLAALVGGVYVAHKAVRAYVAVQETLFAAHAKKVAANAAIARSYDGVAASATRAAAAETTAAGAGGAGAAGAAGRVGLLATVGGAAVGILAAGIVVAVKEILDRRKLDSDIDELVTRARAGGPAAMLAQARKFGVTPTGQAGQFIIDPDQDSDKTNAGARLLAEAARIQERVASHLADVGATVVALEGRVSRGRATLATLQQRRLDPSTLDRSAGIFGGAFTALPDRHPVDVADARQSARDAAKGVRDAVKELAEARKGEGGASSGQLASAEAGVLSARDAVRRRGGNSQAEQLRLEAAEARLADLREKGGTNADKIREAEDKLAAARRTSAKAHEDAVKAEKGTALSAADVVKRIGGQLSNAKTLVADEGALIKKGVSGPLLRALQDIEKEAPGSFDQLAKSMTPALAKSLSAQYAELQKTQFMFYDAPRVAAIKQAEAALGADEARLAAAQAKAYRDALRAEGVELTPRTPTPTGPGGRPEAPDTAASTSTSGPLGPNEHGTPVVIHVDGFNAEQIRQIAEREARRILRQPAGVRVRG